MCVLFSLDFSVVMLAVVWVGIPIMVSGLIYGAHKPFLHFTDLAPDIPFCFDRNHSYCMCVAMDCVVSL